MKKFFGIVLIIFSALLALLFIVAAVPVLYTTIINLQNNPGTETTAMLIGNIIGLIIFFGISGLICFLGLKLIRRNKTIAETKEEF
jgi:uncharacterized membrane protein required for colicin V production